MSEVEKKRSGLSLAGKSLLALGGLMLTGAAAQKLCGCWEKKKLKGAYGWLVEVQGRRMCVKVSGSGKETVVLLPGAGESSPALVYQPLAEALGKQYTTLTVEYFGYGLSDPAPSPRTVENVAEELHELLQRLGLGRYILMAHSYSGVIALEYLNRWPEEVSAYVGIDTTVTEVNDYVDAGAVNVKYGRLRRALNGLGILRLASRISPDSAAAPLEPERYSPKDLQLYRRLCLNVCSTDDMLQELALSTDALERLRGVKIPSSVPVLQFLSTESEALLERYGAAPDVWQIAHRKLSENQESAVEMVKGGHYLQCSHPEEIAEKFCEWYVGL